MFVRDYLKFEFIVDRRSSSALYAGLDEGRYDILVEKGQVEWAHRE